jgi:hypothetical protein
MQTSHNSSFVILVDFFGGFTLFQSSRVMGDFINARPHTAAHTRVLFEHFNWELFDHPTYSPDLAPSYYHLFTLLRSQCFNNNEGAEGTRTWPTSQAAYINTGIQKRIP